MKTSTHSKNLTAAQHPPHRRSSLVDPLPKRPAISEQELVESSNPFDAQRASIAIAKVDGRIIDDARTIAREVARLEQKRLSLSLVNSTALRNDPRRSASPEWQRTLALATYFCMKASGEPTGFSREVPPDLVDLD